MRKVIWSIILFIFTILLFWACDSISNNDSDIKKQNDVKNEDTAYKIVIDPGHGGIDVGATGTSGQYEKNFNLSVSKKVKELLEKDPQMDVYMTRTDDSHLSQDSRFRPEYANDLNADLFISIHGNTFLDPGVSGTETLYYHKNSNLLAKILQKHLVEATGFKDRGIKKEDLFVVKDTKMPAALIEVGYLTNPQDESQMWTEDFQIRVATSFVEGIKEYKAKSEKEGKLIHYIFGFSSLLPSSKKL